jgi:hypothetical protein
MWLAAKRYREKKKGNYYGHYQTTPAPRLPRICRPLKDRFDEKWIPEPFSGCWLWTAAWNPQGYGQFTMPKRPQLAHRMAWTFYKGEIPTGVHVLHKCDTPACVNPDHLFLGSHQDNMTDAYRKGRVAIGQKVGGCKLTAEQVIAIRGDERRYGKIGEAYGISVPHVSEIKRRLSWKHIP